MNCVYVLQAGTHVVFGVKAEIGEPLSTATNEGRIEFSVDWYVLKLFSFYSI